MAISFVGSKTLAGELGPDDGSIYVPQVVPSPDDASMVVVAKYQAGLAACDPETTPSFVSREGYLSGRLAIMGVDACGSDLNARLLPQCHPEQAERRYLRISSAIWAE
jgi:hypothetical protein